MTPTAPSVRSRKQVLSKSRWHHTNQSGFVSSSVPQAVSVIMVSQHGDHCAPTGRGWIPDRNRLGFDAEVAEIPELLAAHVATPCRGWPVRLVIHPSNLFLTPRSIGHAPSWTGAG